MDWKLVALYKHWLAADSVKQIVGAEIPISAKGRVTLAKLPADFVAAGELHSMMLRLSVWYALLYVVIEGYRSQPARDEVIDTLLAKGRFVPGELGSPMSEELAIGATMAGGGLRDVIELSRCARRRPPSR
jgi:hypothetical protein